MPAQTIFEMLGPLYEYPGDSYGERARLCLAEMSRTNPEAAARLAEFCGAIECMHTDELQELYTRTFDLNPVCTLEIGWHLYGEDYARGDFLVKMRAQLRQAEVPESTELPDHLTHALALLARLEPDEAAAFAGHYLLPAIDKMLGAWQKEINPYRALVESAFVLLQSLYPYEPARQLARVPALTVIE